MSDRNRPSPTAPRAPGIHLLALVFACLLACGSDDEPAGGGDGGAGSGPPSGVGNLSWLEDGVRRTALVSAAARVTSLMTDMLQVSGGQSGGIGIAFGVSTPPPLAPGTYTCGLTGNNVITTFSYNDAGVFQTCTITLTSVGAKTGERAVGTFSATFPAAGGGTKAITGGTFDIPQTVTALF